MNMNIFSSYSLIATAVCSFAPKLRLLLILTLLLRIWMAKWLSLLSTLLELLPGLGAGDVYTLHTPLFMMMTNNNIYAAQPPSVAAASLELVY